MIKKCKKCKSQFISKLGDICPKCSGGRSDAKQKSKKAHYIEDYTGKSSVERESDDRRMDAYYRRTYGISLEIFNEMSKKQDYRCAICGAATKLLVDHNHETGKVRGLLCNNCNTGLGVFRDSIGILNSAANYIIRDGGK